MRRRFLAWTVVLVASLCATQAVAQGAGNEAAAREAFERGRVFYDSGEFTQAAESFEEAHRLSGRDALLYNVYLAHRDANQPAQAAEALRSYLQKVPNIENRAQLEARLHALEQGLERERKEHEREAQAAPAAATTTAPIAAPPIEGEPAASKPGRSPRFIAGVALASVGGAMALGSLATGLMARSRQNELERECDTAKVCDDGLRSKADSGKRLAYTTDALLFGGLAIAAGGAVLLVLELRKGGEQKGQARGFVPQVDASCSGRGCGATATVQF
jgi:tetratricopeptide (TPR) repeat protein